MQASCDQTRIITEAWHWQPVRLSFSPHAQTLFWGCFCLGSACWLHCPNSQCIIGDVAEVLTSSQNQVRAIVFFYHTPLFPCVLFCFCINVSLLIVDSFIRFPLGTIWKVLILAFFPRCFIALSPLLRRCQQHEGPVVTLQEAMPSSLFLWGQASFGFAED